MTTSPQPPNEHVAAMRAFSAPPTAEALASERLLGVWMMALENMMARNEGGLQRAASHLNETARQHDPLAAVLACYIVIENVRRSSHKFASFPVFERACRECASDALDVLLSRA